MIQFLADVWPYLLGFYVIDALVLLRRGESLFILSGAQRVRRQLWFETGIRFTGLWPSLKLIAPYRPPLFVTEAGILVTVSSEPAASNLPESDELELIPFDDRPFETEDASVVRGRRRVLVTPSAACARRLCEHLEILRNAVPARRIDTLEKLLASALDVEHFRERLIAFTRATRVLTACAWSYAVALFVLLPLTLYTPPGTRLDPRRAALVVGVLWIANLALAFRLLRLLPGQGVAGPLVTMLVLPAAAAHPLAAISKAHFSDVDPLIAAAALLPWDEARLLLRRDLSLQRLLRQRLGPEVAPYLQLREKLILRLVARLGRSESELLAPPPRFEEETSFCPLCSCLYADERADCGDCRVPLERFV